MNKKASLSVIFVTVFIDLLGFGLLIPILPTFASKELNITDFQIGLLVAVYSFMQFLFNPFFGNYSDKVGRRPIILITLLINAASYIIFSFAHSFFLLLISRLLAGFGGSNIGVAQAYIADVTDAKDRTKGMGLIGAAFGLGFVFGPFFGGILSGYGYEIVGYVAAGFSFLAFIFASIFLKESIAPNKNIQHKSRSFFSLSALNEIKTEKKLSFYIIIYFIIVFSMANIYGTFALLGFKLYNLNDRHIGYLYAVMGITSVLVQGGMLRYLLKYITEEKILIIGLVFTMIGIGFMPYGVNIIGLGIISVISSIGTSSLQPTILGLVSKETNQESQGKILGLNQSVAALARVLGPIWGGFAFDYLGFEFPFLTGGFFSLLTLIISYKMLFSKSSKVKNV